MPWCRPGERAEVCQTLEELASADREMSMAAQQNTAGESAPKRRNVVKDGHLPVNELLFDRPGAGSPFGDEVEFPLPTDNLMYRHPDQAAPH